MELYASFPDDIVLGSVSLLERFFRSQTSVSTDALSTPSDVQPEEVATPIGGPLNESMPTHVPHEKWVKMEAPPNQFPG